eukprot:867429-Pelagomonas_calceolata.AAC.4
MQDSSNGLALAPDYYEFCTCNLSLGVGRDECRRQSQHKDCLSQHKSCIAAKAWSRSKVTRYNSAASFPRKSEHVPQECKKPSWQAGLLMAPEPFHQNNIQGSNLKSTLASPAVVHAQADVLRNNFVIRQILTCYEQAIQDA